MADGLILYSDQLTKGSVGDFISFGMSNGFAEFRLVPACYCHNDLIYRPPLTKRPLSNESDVCQILIKVDESFPSFSRHGNINSQPV